MDQLIRGDLIYFHHGMLWTQRGLDVRSVHQHSFVFGLEEGWKFNLAFFLSMVQNNQFHDFIPVFLQFHLIELLSGLNYLDISTECLEAQ